MRNVLIALLVLLVACTYMPPEAVAPERAPTPIAAPFDRTWNAVIDVFADRNIPIRTIDRSSGFVATEALDVNSKDGKAWAACGSNGITELGPERATYNVLVRGDTVRSTVRITVSWSADAALMRRDTRMVECVTSGAWETEAEKDVKTRAERPSGAP